MVTFKTLKEAEAYAEKHLYCNNFEIEETIHGNFVVRTFKDNGIERGW